jgi:stage III sporulation protein AH
MKSLILNRKQFMLIAFVLVLLVAVIIGWNSLGAPKADTTGAVKAVSQKSKAAASGASAPNDDYFATARLTRENAAAQAEDLLNSQASGTSLTDTEEQSAESEIQAINNDTAAETALENSIKQIGFKDCVAFINNGIISIVVMPKTGNTLSDSEVGQIVGIVTQQTQASPDNIFIMTQP